jgi:hypothetical protein
MKKRQAGSRSTERSAERTPTSGLAAQIQELRMAVAMAHGPTVLSAQEHRALAKLIDALALLLDEVPENI